MNNVSDIFKSMKRVRLTHEEREHVRAVLHATIDQNPIQGDTGNNLLREQPVRFFLSAAMHKPALLLIIVALVLAGGGTAAAAESALPGDILYPVKVNLNEPMRAAFAFSSEAKGNWAVELAARRMLEAEELAVSGKLNSDTADIIEQSLERHQFHLEKIAQALDQTDHKESAAQIRSMLEATLNAHGDVILALGPRLAPLVRPSVGKILDHIGDELEHISPKRFALEGAVATSTVPAIDRAARAKIGALKNKIDEVASFIAKSSSDAETKALANKKLSEARAKLSKAETSLADSAFGKAFMLAQEALRSAQEAKVIIAAATRMGVSIHLKTDRTGTVTVNVVPTSTLAAPFVEEIRERLREREEELENDFQQTQQNFRDRRERLREQLELLKEHLPEQYDDDVDDVDDVENETAEETMVAPAEE